MTASEQATLNFYQWEYQHRGYYHFDTPVDIEVPYVPFRHFAFTNTPIIDDGRVPSLFKQVTKLLSPPKEEPTQDVAEIEPRFLAFDSKSNLVGISISFPKGTEIQPNRNIEFLNMLSFTEHLLSFEIVGNSEKITIQIVFSEYDKGRVESHVQAYFSTAIIRTAEIDDFGFVSENDIAIADFGLNDEYMRSIATVDSFTIDPLTSVIATMESLQQNDVVVFQILFKGITSPLAKDITYSVSDGTGGSFFADAPEMPNCAKDKIANPLFSVVMRIATQGKSKIRSQYLAQELARSISTVSSSEYNKLIPLENIGYDYDFHKYNLHHRLSNRLGCVLNSKELNTFLHYPNKTIVSQKIGLQGGKTKSLPKEAINQKYILGINEHNGVETNVSLSSKARLEHTYILGVTGTGKSTLIAQMMLQDINNQKGCILFDPHGDITDDILLRIPKKRINDVILVDPSDIEFPIGFNLFQTSSEAEKIVLSSDLVSSFKRYATAWGDNMTAVLSNAINTFLESSKGGTLIELKRFLLEDTFRNEYLQSVDDPSLHYYWKHEYYMVKKGIVPLLTRIDTFLRPKIVRYMLAQKNGLDLKNCIEKKKIVLVKLSIGLIGRDNAYLLGSLFLSKLNQVALGRQYLPKKQRSPYFVYIDEFHNFITPSINEMLSGVRKYGLGLTLSHQELGQIDDTKIINSVISNPYTRICFRLGDIDARKLEGGFSYFEQSDLQSLGTGEALMRVGSSSNDFNIDTFPLPQVEIDATANRNYIISNTRNNYAQPKEKLDKLLISLLPKQIHLKKENKKDIQIEKISEKNPITPKDKSVEIIEPKPDGLRNESDTFSNNVTELEKQEFIKKEELYIRNRDHIYLQTKIKKLGQERGYLSTIEKELPNGQRIDIALEKDRQKIAVEVAINNKVEYELNNIKKCLVYGYLPIIVVSKNRKHLNNIERIANAELSKKDIQSVMFIQPKDITEILDAPNIRNDVNQDIVKGFRVTTQYEQSNISTAKNIREHIAKMLFKKR